MCFWNDFFAATAVTFDLCVCIFKITDKCSLQFSSAISSKKVAVRVGFLHFVVSFVLIIWVEYTQWLDGIVMCFHQRDHQLIATSHREFWSSYNQDSLEVEASSELKSPPPGELVIKKWELYPQTYAPKSSTHSFKQIACISWIIY